MQIINHHQVFATIGLLEHEMRLHALIGAARRILRLKELACQRLTHPVCRFRLDQCLDIAISELGLPADLLLLDKFIQHSNGQKVKKISLNVEGSIVGCLVSEVRVLTTHLALDRTNLGFEKGKRNFLFRKSTPQQLQTIEVSENVKNLFNSRQPNNLKLSSWEYTGMIEHQVLSPTCL